MKYGVPQGSGVGTLLFVFYVNHFVHVFDTLYKVLFANGTNFFMSQKSQTVLQEIAHFKLPKVDFILSGPCVFSGGAAA